MSNESVQQGRGRGVLIGVLLLAVGAIMLMSENVHFGNVWRLWPVFMIIAGINSLFEKGRRTLFSSILLVGMGFLFLEMNYRVIGLNMRHFAPIVVLIVGLGFIVDALERQRTRNDNFPTGGAS